MALVTGAGRGIEQALALKFAKEGARLVVNDLDASAVDDTLLLVKEQGAEALGCPGSVTERDCGERFVSQAVDSFGGINIIVNGAGYTWDAIIQKSPRGRLHEGGAAHLRRRAAVLDSVLRSGEATSGPQKELGLA